ncbi:dethiobiotin synthase [Undibacterium sp. Ren11W]|uniref:dethiobiotin synthase n=1 Tax=Undibacterium sp. Ren11W TaxID=3413045 RepID=UPI003BF0D769
MMLQRPHDYFVTGTDTEIGKTLVSAALLLALAQRGQSTIGMKPVAAGADLIDGVWHNEDVDALMAAATMRAAPELVAPYLMQTPAAPHIVAELENVTISGAHIQSCYQVLTTQADVVIVEGVGGFCVPLNADLDTADMAQTLGLPVILVVGMRLGCISHALLTAEAIAARGLKLAGWVANTVDENMLYPDENLAALRARLPAPLLGRIPRINELTQTRRAQAAAACLNLNFLTL